MQIIDNKTLFFYFRKLAYFIIKSYFLLLYPAANSLANTNCTITAIALNFGTINPYDLIPETSTTTVSVRCAVTGSTLNVSYTLTFSPGNSLNASARILKLGTTSTMSYNIYKLSSYSQILGTGTGGTFTITNSYTLAKNSNRTDNFTIYGQIPAQPLSKPGSYTDTLTVTLTY